MFEILQKAGAFLATLAVLVVFHEWGHYIVARLCGVRVLRFSVGFGRVLWSRRFGPDGTEWALSAIPLGGYVKMLDEREVSVAGHEVHRAFNRQTVWKRIAIVAAGPAANLLLAVALFTTLYVVGIDGLRAVVAAPAQGTPAAETGLQAGDEIVRIDGETVQSWQDLRWRLLRRSGAQQAVLEVRGPDGRTSERPLGLGSLSGEDWEGAFLGKLGLALNAPPMPATIGNVMGGLPAERAGLRAGDRVESIDGRPVSNWEQLAGAIADRPDRTVELVIVRGSIREVVTVRSESAERDGKRVGRIGISPQVDPEAYAPLRVTTRYGLIDAFLHGVERTWDLSTFTVRMLWKMIVGEASLKNISGPITLADFAGQSAQQGTSVFLGYLALISISLGVLNLLPVPLLDGGHLMYYLAEVFTGRPVSERTLEIGQQIGMAVLFALMGLAFYNDLARLF